MSIITPWPPQRGAEIEHVANWDVGTVERVHGGVGGDRVVTSTGLTLHRETYDQTWRVQNESPRRHTMAERHRCGEHGTYTGKNDGVTRCSVCKADAPPPHRQSLPDVAGYAREGQPDD